MYLARKTILIVTFVVLGLVPKSVRAQQTLWVDAQDGSDSATGSCDDPFQSVNRALQVPGYNTIWVRPGTYTAGPGGFDFGNRALALRSTSANAPEDTTLLGRVSIGPASSGSLVEGFTVTNTSGTGIDVSGASLTIRGNVITGCTNGGIVLDGSQALVIDNVISNNQRNSGAGILIANLDDGETVKIVDCQLLGNTAQLGSGGGIVVDSKGEVWVVNTVIRGNSATAGGGGTYFVGIPVAGSAGGTDPCADPKLTVHMQNCLITCNTALGDVLPGAGGGGLHFASLSKGELSNCTFSQNSADLWGGGLFAGDSCVQAYNSVFWDNTASAGGEIANSYANLTLDHNVVEGGCAGVHLNYEYDFNCTNVINDNPDFLDPDGADNTGCNSDDDYRLKHDAPGGSPAVDSGDNTKVLADFTDVDRDGNTSESTPRDLARRFRFVDDSPPGTAIVDLGAYESVRCATSPDCLDPADPCEGDAQCVSNWCDILQLDCNYDGDHDLFCEIALGEPDCNNNTCPDADEGAACDVALVSSVYACEDSLPRFQKTTLRLTFKCALPALPVPPAYPVRIHKLADGGEFEGSDLAANFTYTLPVEGANKVLKIRDNATTLANTTWYGIRRGSSWNGVLSFKRDYVTVYGDADNTKLNDFADLSFIFANFTGVADDVNRSDINADTFVDNADIANAFSFNGSAAPPKPTGHTCVP